MAKDNYKAKEGQDRWVLDILKNKTNGYFVDIGAHNGYNDSNSYVLEKDFGWKGICVEPHHWAALDLQKNRNCNIEVACISDIDGEVDFVQRGKYQQVSGMYHPDVDDHVIDQVDLHSHPLVKKPSLTLLSLLEKYNAPNIIDYLSIDAEGAELLILKNFDFQKYNFLTVTLEHNYTESNKLKEKNGIRRKEIQALLVQNGYVLSKSVSADDWYVLYGYEK